MNRSTSTISSALLFCLAILAGGCAGAPPRAPGTAGCANGLDKFEKVRCQVMPTAGDRAVVDAEYQNFHKVCTDEASKQRLQQLEICVSGYHLAEAKQLGELEAFRAHYQKKIDAVKADPEYTPTLEARSLAHDEVKIAEDDLNAKGEKSEASPYYRVYKHKAQKLEQLDEKLRQIAQKHGIKPDHAEVLELW